MRDYVSLLRPRQYLKNGFVLAPLLFAQELFHISKCLAALLAFVAFCLASSFVYIVNDIADQEEDRLHPQKRLRPIASGAISTGRALVMALVLLLASGLCVFRLPYLVAVFIAVYIALHTAYSYLLKHVVILDVMVIAVGFVLRVLAGAYAIQVLVSEWILLCTFLLAMFLGFAKRRHEMLLLGNEADAHREVLHHYSPYLLDQLTAVLTGATVISYALYTIWPTTVKKFGTTKLIFTVPFVVFGIFRYLYLVHKKEAGGSPTAVMFTDIPLIINVLLWALVAGAILYVG